MQKLFDIFTMREYNGNVNKKQSERSKENLL